MGASRKGLAMKESEYVVNLFYDLERIRRQTILRGSVTKHAYIRHAKAGWNLHLRSYKQTEVVAWEVFWYPTWEQAVRALSYLWRRS